MKRSNKFGKLEMSKFTMSVVGIIIAWLIASYFIYNWYQKKKTDSPTKSSFNLY